MPSFAAREGRAEGERRGGEGGAAFLKHCVSIMLEKWPSPGTQTYRHMVLLDALGWDDEKLPKHHLMVHLTDMMESSDNAWDHACFLDESLNKLLKLACKNANSLNFETYVFTKLKAILEHDSRKRKVMA